MYKQNQGETMKNVVIFSVYQNNQVEDHNYLNTVKARGQLNESGVEYQNCLGVYNKKAELSMILEIDYTDLAEMISSEYKQESVLIVEDDGRASLKFLNSNKVEYIGVFTQVEMSEAVKQDYTKVAGKYFICK